MGNKSCVKEISEYFQCSEDVAQQIFAGMPRDKQIIQQQDTNYNDNIFILYFKDESNPDITFILLRITYNRFITVYDTDTGFKCKEYSKKDIVNNINSGNWLIVKQ